MELGAIGGMSRAKLILRIIIISRYNNETRNTENNRDYL